MITERLTSERLSTDLTSWEIGPYYDALPGPMKMRLLLDGEIIVSGEIETGFVHRGLEKAMELQNWQVAVAYADRLDPENAFFAELALCMAVEEISQFETPARALNIRLILSELSRVCTHLGYVVKVAKAVNAETMVHYALRDRERVLDLFELLTGARYSINFLRYGGVKLDMTAGFLERVLETCDLIRIRLKEYNDLFTYNHAFLKRTRGMGVLSSELIKKYGITGPNARASGVLSDTRKEHPYLGYEKLNHHLISTSEQSSHQSADCHSRFVIRLNEISQSLEILRAISDAVPPGEFELMKVEKDFAVPSGEAFARVESGRGRLGIYVVADGSARPSRIQFSTPSPASLLAVPELIVGIRVEDLPVLLASLDLGLAEIDK